MLVAILTKLSNFHLVKISKHEIMSIYVITESNRIYKIVQNTKIG